MISDAHVHFGADSITGEIMDEKRLEKVIRKFHLESLLLFPFDIDMEKTNEKVLQISKKKRQVYGLLRIRPEKVSEYLHKLPKLLDDKLVGVKFHPSMEKTRVTDPVYKPILEILNEHGAIALIHAGRWEEMSSYKFPIEVANNYPNIKVIMAHMGGNEIPNTKDAIQRSKNIKNLFLDTSNCRVPFLVRLAVKEVGARRILFGSDIPFGSLMSNLYTIIDANLAKKEYDYITSRNLNELLHS